MYRTDFGTLCEKARVGCSEGIALKQELMLLNFGVGEDLGEDLESPLDCTEVKPVNPKSVLNIHWKD